MKLTVKIGKRYLFLSISDIDYIRSEGNYCRIFLGDTSYLIRETLYSMEEKLSIHDFVRVNRSTLVNIDRIRELRLLKHSKYMVILEDEISWIWGEKFRHNIRRVLNR